MLSNRRLNPPEVQPLSSLLEPRIHWAARPPTPTIKQTCQVSKLNTIAILIATIVYYLRQV